MDAEPLPVTVVIPAHRRAELLERAIASALRQTRPAAEIVVVDDASGDDTGARAAALGVRVLTHERNLGEGASRNTALEAATHDWVALLDSDDEWLPHHLETLWAARAGHVLVGSAMLGTGPGRRAHRVYGWAGRRPLLLAGPAAVALPENRLHASAVLFRRQPALAAGGFRANMPRAADLDLWLRLTERGTALAIPEVTALYHLHGDQASADRAPMRAAARSVLDEYADRPWCTPAVRRRHAGALAWDDARAAIAAGAPRRSEVLPLAAALLRSPNAAIGVAALLADRARGRRVAARHAPGAALRTAIAPRRGPRGRGGTAG